ncbi:MAG: hypothetical protein AAF939_12890 [Planctomycetota bacterium]
MSLFQFWRNSQSVEEALQQCSHIQREMEVLSDVELQEYFENIQSCYQRDQSNGTFSDWRQHALAVGFEAIRREMGFRLHDVQRQGAWLASQGSIIQMQTGEGKTVVCVLTAIIQAVITDSIHVATTNDYLAARDHEIAEPIFKRLGIKSNVVDMNLSPAAKKSIYRQQVVYGAGHVFGFDYLSDQVSLRKRESIGLGNGLMELYDGHDVESTLLQPYRKAVIIDEADSVLVDESTTPLILSGGADSGTASDQFAIPYLRARVIADSLNTPEEYTVNKIERKIELTERGAEEIHIRLAELGRLELAFPWSSYVENALFAEHFLDRGEHYIVEDDAVKLVDQMTGRIFADRNLKNGLHQAVEAKEEVTINLPQSTLARITRQRFFQQYDCVCGMTGTVMGIERELKHFYSVSSQVIPTHLPGKRRGFPSLYFDSWKSKADAIVNEIFEISSAARPILIGTRTIAESDRLHDRLQQEGIHCELLNGVQEKEEAEIVSMAGQSGSVTIATNMAGRGTDIKLCDVSKSTGGLHVIATQHSESERVDRQLIGRSARQGQPGSFRFFVAADDDLFQGDGAYLAKSILASSNSSGSSDKDFSSEILALQKRKDNDGFVSRRRLVEFDSWMDGIRETMVNR